MRSFSWRVTHVQKRYTYHQSQPQKFNPNNNLKVQKNKLRVIQYYVVHIWDEMNDIKDLFLDSPILQVPAIAFNFN